MTCLFNCITFHCFCQWKWVQKPCKNPQSNNIICILISKSGTVQPTRTSPSERGGIQWARQSSLAVQQSSSINWFHSWKTDWDCELHWFLSFHDNEGDRCYFVPVSPSRPCEWAQMVIFSCSLQSGHIELGLCRCWIIYNSAATADWPSNIWWETWHMLLHLLDQMSDWSSPAQSAQSPLTSWNISKRAHSTFYNLHSI